MIAGGSVAYALLPHPLNYDIDGIAAVGSRLKVVEKAEDEVTVQTNSEDFKILLFTDMHLDGKNKTSNVTVSHLIENISREKPDLVLLGGDNVTSAFNRKRANQLAQIFEKLGVYWAGGLGNHEGDNKYSVTREEMIDIFSSYDHCLIRKGAEDIWGVGNYALNILNADGSLRHTYYFLDTGDEMSSELKAQYGFGEDDSPTDGAKESQVAWYTQKNDALRTKCGSFQSTLVVHIPLPQYKTAAENVTFLYGDKLENICASAFDAGLFDALQSGGTTKTVFCGHDHLNTFGIDCDGILLSYIQPSGYGSYTAASRLGYEEKDWLQGYTKLELQLDGTFTASRYRNHASEEAEYD